MAEEQTTPAADKPAKTRAPRKRTPKAAEPAATTGEAGAAAPEKKAPAPRKKAAKKPVTEPAAPAPAPAEQPKQEKEKQPRAEKASHREQPAAEQPQHTAPAPQQPSPNAKPIRNSEEHHDDEKPLVRHIEQSAPKPTSVPGFATPETVGGAEGNNGNGRRKRRRNRNRRGGEGQQPQQQGAPQPRVNPDELQRRAWKIFLGEVTEEGLALMDDRTAQEASRRAFRVAELFLQEAARHKPAAESAPETPEEALEGAETDDTTEE